MHGGALPLFCFSGKELHVIRVFAHSFWTCRTSYRYTPLRDYKLVVYDEAYAGIFPARVYQSAHNTGKIQMLLGFPYLNELIPREHGTLTLLVVLDC